MKKITLVSAVAIMVATSSLFAGEKFVKAITKGNATFLAKIDLKTFQEENVGDKMGTIMENCPGTFATCARALAGGLKNKDPKIRAMIVSEITAMIGDKDTRSYIAKKYAGAIKSLCGTLNKHKDKDAEVTSALTAAKAACAAK